MKNIHILPTDKPSRLDEFGKFYVTELMESKVSFFKNQNIYITSDEEIKDGEYGICLNLVREGFKSEHAVFKMDVDQRLSMEDLGGQKKAEVLKVILTTDQDLIKDGVQAIPNDFLEWFVKNPSCEEVEINQEFNPKNMVYGINTNPYKIIIPKEEQKDINAHTGFDDDGNSLNYQGNMLPLKEEPKQETLEEAAEQYAKSKTSHKTFQETYKRDFSNGAKWNQERSYSEEEFKTILNKLRHDIFIKGDIDIEKWFEQFKKK